MPQGSRKGNRSNNNISNNVSKSNDSEKYPQSISTNISNGYSIKHAHIPVIPYCNMALFHLILLVFSLTATLMQYLHIYRTVWWLPHSHAKKALNFYLIDPHLFGYVISIESVPFIYSLYTQVMQMQDNHNSQQYTHSTTNTKQHRFVFYFCLGLCCCLISIWFMAFCIFSWLVYIKTSGFYLLILFYPPIAYVVIYYHYMPYQFLMNIKSLFLRSSSTASPQHQTNNNINSSANNISPNVCSNLSNENEQINNSMGSINQANESNLPSNNGSVPVTTTTGNNGYSTVNRYNKKPMIDGKSVSSPTQMALEQYGIFYYSKTVRHPPSTYVHHNCTMNPEDIREEVELLKSDFNRKFRDIFFGTLFTFFYAGLVPLLFVPRNVIANNGTILSAVHYDGVWCVQHVCVTAVTSFLLYSVQLLTPAYVDVLHRAALHLGKWRREESRTANVPYNVWSQLQIFPKGALVKHVRGLFRAVGIYNSAEPGNNMHNRFFMFFYPALRLANVLCVLVLVILAVQYSLLIHNYEWYKIISVASMMFFNVVNLYKILRNRFLLARCYKEEEAQQHNLGGGATGGSVGLGGGSACCLPGTHGGVSGSLVGVGQVSSGSHLHLD